MTTPDLFSRKINRREMQIAEKVADGETNEQIAKDTGLSLSTVGRYISRVCDKTGAENRTQVAMWFVRNHGPDAQLVARIAELELENARLRKLLTSDAR